MSSEYEISIGPGLGLGEMLKQEDKFFSRVIKRTEQGLEYEPDLRQVEMLLSDQELEGAKPMAKPSARATSTELTTDTELGKDLHTACPAAVARGNNLAANRVDTQFACKDCADLCRTLQSMLGKL